MEDAIALDRAFAEHGDSVEAALVRFKALRAPPMRKIWDAANISLRWYERMGELMRLDPVDFAHSYITRTGRVSMEQFGHMAPDLAAAFAKQHPNTAV
jgi:hypothetical protein